MSPKIKFIAFVALALTSNKKDDCGIKDFPVNGAFTAEKIGKGIPPDIAPQ